MPRPRRSNFSPRSRNAIRQRNIARQLSHEEREIAREKRRVSMERRRALIRASQTQEQREAARETARLEMRNRRAYRTDQQRDNLQSARRNGSSIAQVNYLMKNKKLHEKSAALKVDPTEVNNMEAVMLEYAELNRDLNQYIGAVEETIRKVRREAPDEIPDLKQLVHQTLAGYQKKNRDEALKKSDKFIQFKEQLRDLRQQMGVSQGSADQASEEEDEDIAVTQSIANFSCPITQMELVNPVKNKVCGHTYEKEAIEKMIQSRHEKNKNARCPKVGCDVSDMNISDLVPDSALKRAIDIHKRQSQTRQAITIN